MSSNDEPSVVDAASPNTSEPLTIDVRSADPSAVGNDGASLAGASIVSARAEADTREALSPPDRDARDRASHLTRTLPVLPRATRLRAAADWILFLLFAAIGFSSIVLLKYLGIQGLVVAGLAVVAMVAYGVLAWVLPNVRMRPDKLGDNVYYLGFVFTLASMAEALIELHGGTDVSNLIGSFGVALFTTIAGIVGRVTLLQVRTEVEDVEELVRRDLLEHAHRLRGQLSAAIGDLETFRLGVRQAVEERLREALETHQRILEKQFQSLEEIVADVRKKLEAASAVNKAALDEMHEGVSGTVKELKNLWSRFAKVQAPSDILDRKLDGAMARMLGVVQVFESTAKAETERHAGLSQAAQDLGSLITALTGELSRLQGVSEKIAEAGAPASHLTTTFAALSEQVEALGVVVNAQKEATGSAASVAEQHRVAVGQALAACNSDMAALHAAVSVATTALVEATRETSGQLKTASSALSSQGAVMKATADDAEAARRKISEHLSESLAALAQMQRAIAESAAKAGESLRIGTP